MLRYYRIADDEKTEITYEKALDIMLGSWRDSDMTRDMLGMANRIRCRFSVIEVEDENEHGTKVLVAGLWNMLPMDVEYDDNCNRISL